MVEAIIKLVMTFNFKIIGLIGLLGIILVAALINITRPSTLASAKELEISPGISFDEISDKLADEGFIRSKILFEAYALITGRAHQFKPGRYFLFNDISIPALVKTLVNGPIEISVVIYPGMTLREIDDRLSSLKIIKPSELIDFNTNDLSVEYPWLAAAQDNLNINLEGFLLPDTYNFFTGSDINSVVKKILDNFKVTVLPFFNKYDNLPETINLASLLEKEVPDYNDRQIVGGILIKRLNAGMPLQVDATLFYAKCSGRFLDCPAPKIEDYKIDSPYNTYIYNGLPKSAIDNPSLDAIKAALNPQKSAYWYYLSDPKTGKTIFSKTLEEHNQNRAKYLLNK